MKYIADILAQCDYDDEMASETITSVYGAKRQKLDPFNPNVEASTSKSTFDEEVHV